MKKFFYRGLALLFFISPGTVFAQTLQFEYDVSQKYPIYTTFEGNISAASEMTGWFYDERSWHYNEGEWTLLEGTTKYTYTGGDKNNWIIDGGKRFYMGPDDNSHYYAYLQNAANDWEMFMMNANDKNVIYATGNEIFDRIDGAPSNSNPYKGIWRSRADNTLVAVFDENGQNGGTGSCKLTFTNQYKNTPLVGKADTGAPAPFVKPRVAGTTATRNRIIETAKKYQGKRYQWGSTGPNTFDCSGFTYVVYKEATGITIPRSSSAVEKQCTRIKKNELKAGDLILFDTNEPRRGSASHVAIYMGNDEIIHSYEGIPRSQKIGVTVTKLEDNTYWEKRMLYGIRILAD
ncbi:hypothetical protein AGMMS4952_03190 [Spirochaetia bacterium]|nr:hypothetical protein AGMMS4952_03190 [Spirochaetia bacterium]